ncbi:MAG: hypothetical protein QGI93_08630 [Planctomycetota bacterium]|nr:hypothetical protein [Planctomycetota bacterium]
MKILELSTTLAMACLLTGCQATVQVVDQRPGLMSDAQASAGQWIGSMPRKGTLNMGSAVAIGPDRLLTNAHVWAPDDPWWGAELPAEQKMYLFERGIESQTLINGEPVEVEVSDRIRGSSFRLIASGMSALEFDSEGTPTYASMRNSDWAVIETDSPSWRPEEVAVIHPPAMDPDWLIPEGVELFILGYSPIFEGTPLGGRGDSEGSGTSKISSDLIPFIRGGPYTIKGRSEISDGIWSVTYPHEWPQPSGHSGGGVFLWNEKAQRPELVGVFHTWDQATITTTKEFSLFGSSSLLVQSTSKEKVRSLAFSPISGACQALGLHRD